jgi:hypothetical protein
MKKIILVNVLNLLFLSQAIATWDIDYASHIPEVGEGGTEPCFPNAITVRKGHSYFVKEKECFNGVALIPVLKLIEKQNQNDGCLSESLDEPTPIGFECVVLNYQSPDSLFNLNPQVAHKVELDIINHSLYFKNEEYSECEVNSEPCAIIGGN